MKRDATDQEGLSGGTGTVTGLRDLNSAPLSYWAGVYESFEAAGGSDAAFDKAFWRQRVLQVLSDHQAGVHHLQNDELLGWPGLNPAPLIAASVYADRLRRERNMPIRILDFGGGAGIGYVQLRTSLPSHVRLDYRVVERRGICDIGQAHFRGNAEIGFHESLAMATRDACGIDIALAASALHYMNDWQGLLSSFAALDPRWILLLDVPAGDIPASFVTVQMYHGDRIPVWFWRMEHLVRTIEQLGYALTHRALRRWTGQAGESPPMDGLPTTHRIAGFCDLSFAAIRERRQPGIPDV